MTNRTIGVALTADPTGLQKGFSAGSSAAQQFATETNASLGRAAAASSRMVAATDQVKQSVDGVSLAGRAHSAAADRFVRDMERQVAAIGKTRIELLELQAAELGVGARTAPMLAQLRASETGLRRVGMSAKETAFALRGVPAQFTDIAVSLATGQRPLMVMLQQGGQLKDMFGGIGPAARALGGYVMGIVNPFRLAAGSAALLATAYFKGQQESVEFNKSLILTGGYAGQSSGQLAVMAERIGGISGTTGKAADALAQITATGKFTGSSIEGIGLAAVSMNDATGKAVSDTIAEFVRLGESPADASAKLNEQYHYLTASVYDQIKALEDQGRKQEAATLAQSTFATASQEMAREVKASAGTLERAWSALGSTAKGAWDAMLNIGRPTPVASLQAQAEAIQKEINQLQSGMGAFADTDGGAAVGRGGNAKIAATKNLARKLAEINAQIEQESGDAFARQATAAQKRLDAQLIAQSGVREAYLKANKGNTLATALEAENKEYKNAIQGLKEGTKEYQDVLAAHTSKVAKLKEQFKDKGGASGDSMVATLRARLAEEKALAVELESRGTKTATLNEFERQAAKISEQLTGKLSARERASLETAKSLAEQTGAQVRANAATTAFIASREKYIKSLDDGISKVELEAQSIEDQVSTYGLGKAAIEAITIARLEEQRTLLSGFSGSEEEIARINAEIAARQRLGAAISAKDMLDTQKKASEKAAREWEKTVDNYGDVFRNGFADMLNNGMDGWKSFNKSLVTTFKTTVADQIYKMFAQPFFVQIAASVVGVSGASAAGATVLGGEGGTGSSALSVISAGKNLYSMFTGGFAASGQAITNMGVKLGSQFVADFGYGFGGGANASATTGGMMGVAGSYMAGAGIGITAGNLISGQYAIGGNSNYATIGGTAIGAIFGGPVGAAIGGAIGGVINRAFGMAAKEYGDTSIVGNFSTAGFNGFTETPWEQDGGWFRGDDSGVKYGVLDRGTEESLGQAFSLIKTGTAALAASVGVSASALAGYSKAIKVTLTDDAEKNQALLAESLNGLAEELIAQLVPNIASFAKGGETGAQTLERLSASLATTNSWLSVLRQNLFEVSIAGASAASKLADAFGGLDGLATASDAYYQVAYSESERASLSLENMRRSLFSVNVAMPSTMQELRGMAEALDLNTDSGRAAYAALISLAPEFANTADSITRIARETASGLIEAYTARGQIGAALDVTRLKTLLLKDALASTYSTSGSITTLFLDINSGVLAFGNNATMALTGAQLASQLLGEQIDDLRMGAGSARVDIAGLSAALKDVNTETFVATMVGVFEKLSERIGRVIDDIGGERIAIREAAQQMIDPTVMSPEEIRRRISGINTTLPTNAGLYAAQSQLSAADAVAAQRKREEQAAYSAYAPASAAVSAAQSQIPALSAQLAQVQAVYDGMVEQINIPRKYSEGRAYVRELQAKLPAVQSQLDQARVELNAAQSSTSEARLNELNQFAAAYSQAVAASASAQAAATAAANVAKKSQTDYADALQNFAIDASKSVGTLSRLREETVKYYESQKALAELMSNSAAGLRTTVSDYRFNQLDPEQQFAKLESDYAKAYAMALSTDGEGLAGYADQLNGLLNPLLEKAKEVYSTEAGLNAFIATALARAENVAGRVESLTPKDYVNDSLALLGQIDTTLAALDASARSAEQLIVGAINGGRDATVNGLRQIINALTGNSIAAFASGGDHIGGFRIVGERGPELEATGAARIFNANQTRSILNGGGDTARLEALVAQLIQENANMRIELRAIAVTNAKMAKQGDRNETEGVLMRTDADMPLDVKVTA